MENPSPISPRNLNTSLPKRGKIKAQIFQSLGETIVSAASKAGEALGLRGGGGSAQESPPGSAQESSLGSPDNTDG